MFSIVLPKDWGCCKEICMAFWRFFKGNDKAWTTWCGVAPANKCVELTHHNNPGPAKGINHQYLIGLVSMMMRNPQVLKHPFHLTSCFERNWICNTSGSRNSAGVRSTSTAGVRCWIRALGFCFGPRIICSHSLSF